MAKKETKLTHIQIKDNGIKASNKVGDKLAETKAELENNLLKGLIKGVKSNNPNRWLVEQNNQQREFKNQSKQIINKSLKEVKTGLNNDKTVNLKQDQVNGLVADVKKGMLFLQNDAIKTYESMVQKTLLTIRSKAADDLSQALSKHIASGLNLGVVYQDGKEFQFDTYFEMKTRTDIQHEIGENLVDAGHEAGVIFYITSCYGDCAKDHADYQGKIYYDKDWQSIAPKDRIDEIRSYIAKLDADCGEAADGSVQAVKDGEPFLTTRPNCRHYFMPITIDEVLGIKNNKELEQKRAEMGLNFNGKYQPEKYEALQKQRLNERKIRKAKQEIVRQEQLQILNPNAIEIQSKIAIEKNKIRNYQAEQRELVRKHANLERSYARESLNNRVDFEHSNNQIPLKNIIKVSDSDLVKVQTTKKMIPTQYDVPKEFNAFDVKGIIKIRDNKENRPGSIEHILKGHREQYDDNYIASIKRTLLEPNEVRQSIDKNGKIIDDRYEMIGWYDAGKNMHKFCVVVEKEKGNDELYTVVTAYPLPEKIQIKISKKKKD